MHHPAWSAMRDWLAERVVVLFRPLLIVVYELKKPVVPLNGECSRSRE